MNTNIARARRYARNCIKDTINQTLAPLTELSARLNYIGVFIILILLNPNRSQDSRDSSINSLVDAIEVALYSIPVFFILNAVFSIFRARKQEKEKGEWVGNRFIYHNPVRLITTLVDERDNGKILNFSVTDAENDTLVSYFIETDRSDGRIKVELAWPGGQRPIDFGVPMNQPKGAFRLPKSRKMALLTHVDENSTLTTVRVFMTGWEIGKGDGRG